MRLSRAWLIFLLAMLCRLAWAAATPPAGYFPLVDGNYWDYTPKPIGDNPPSFPYDWTKVAGTGSIGEVETYLVNDSINDRWYLALAYSFDGILCYQMNDTVFSTPQYFLKFPFTVGSYWILDDLAGPMKYTVLSTSETVTTSLATYTNCVKLKWEPSTGSTKDYKLVWLAPFVGMVRQDKYVGGALAKSSELVRLNITILDRTPPGKPTVTIGDRLTSSRTVNASWDSEDLDTDIIEYQAGVSTTADASGMLPEAGWRSFSTETQGELTDLPLEECGTYYVVVRAMNEAGLTSEVGASSSFGFATVVDTTKPTLNKPADTIVECSGATDPSKTGAATATDNCTASPTITYTDSLVNNCGSTKVITRTWKATDAAGNSTSGNQTITVADTTKPTLNKPVDATVEYPGATDPSQTGAATGSDTCGTVAITYSDSVTPGFGNAEVITRTWTATDQCGNSTNGDQIITVVDEIQIIPGSVNLPPGGIQQFTAKVYGPGNVGKKIVWSCGDVNLGKISSSGKLTVGGKMGLYAGGVIATVDGTQIISKADVTVRPGDPYKVIVEPSSATIACAKEQQFTAKVTDRYGNEIKELAFVWTVKKPDAGAFKQGEVSVLIAGAKPGRYAGAVEAAYSKIKGTATVTVVAPPPTRVVVLPSPVPNPLSDPINVQAGKSQKFAAVGYDALERAIQGLKFNWTIVGGNVSWNVTSSGIFTGKLVGDGSVQVQALINGAPAGDTGGKDVEVIPATASKVLVTTSDATLLSGVYQLPSGGPYQFEAQLADTYGNPLESGGIAVTWSRTPTTSGAIDVNGLFTAATKVGVSGSITAKMSGKNGTAKVKIVAGP